MVHPSNNKPNKKKQGQFVTPSKGKTFKGLEKTATTNVTSSQQDDKTLTQHNRSIYS